MLISINGERRAAADARISIFDRGFLFGDAIYEVIGTVHGRPFHLDAHLDRLEASGAAIELDVAALRPRLEQEIAALLAESGPGERYIRIMISRGEAPTLDLLEAEGGPTWIVIVKRLQPVPPELLTRGFRLKSVTPAEIVARVSPQVKSNNRQANVMAHRIARQEGFDDGLFVHPDGTITEGPTWNVFCVLDGAVVTPPLERGLLPGITRRLVLDLCAELGLPAREAPISLGAARAAQEMFLTSTTRWVLPVTELDGEKIGDGAPGPITLRLRAAFLERAEG